LKGARTVILVETILLIAVVVSAGSLYSRVKAEDDAKDRRIAELREALRDLLMRYDDINWQFKQLQEQAAAASADQQASTSPEDDLRRQLEYERRRYEELEDAFDRLAARFDEYMQRAEAQDIAAPDGGPDKRQERERRSELRGIGDEFIDGRIEELQKRIDSTDDPAEQERLAAMGNAIQDMRDVRDRIRTAESPVDRERAVAELSDLRRQFRELVSADEAFGRGRRGRRSGAALAGREQNP